MNTKSFHPQVRMDVWRKVQNRTHDAMPYPEWKIAWDITFRGVRSGLAENCLVLYGVVSEGCAR